MYQAFVYLVEGPRSLFKAVDEFNKIDHSSKLYNKRSGLGCYVKYKLGRDFAVSLLSEHNGVNIRGQDVKLGERNLTINIPLDSSVVGKRFNAVLIVDKDSEETLYRPIYMIACGDIVFDKSPYINIDIPRAKFEKEVN